MPNQIAVYIGTYTGKSGSKGIYRYSLDQQNGTLSGGIVAAELANPSFLAMHPNGKFLYAVGEVAEFEGKKTGIVASFAVESDGGLRLLNQRPSGGTGPCHVMVDGQGKNVLVANYSGGSVAVLPVGADGRLAEPSSVIVHQLPADDAMPGDERRKPHCHSSVLDATGKWALVADLGLDRVFCYRFDAVTGKLKAGDPPAARLAHGAGPRHMAWGSERTGGGGVLYVLNELNSTISMMVYDASRGMLDQVQTLSTLPRGFAGKNSCAEVRVHPSGKFVYASNRGHDSLALFTVEERTGRLTAAGHEPTGGKTPRNFAIAPDGRFLLAANQNSGNILVFAIDQKTGKLNATGQKVDVPAPVCVMFGR